MEGLSNSTVVLILMMEGKGKEQRDNSLEGGSITGGG